MVAVTAEVGGEQVQKARRRLAIAREAGKRNKGRIHEQMVAGVRRSNPLRVTPPVCGYLGYLRLGLHPIASGELAA